MTFLIWERLGEDVIDGKGRIKFIGLKGCWATEGLEELIGPLDSNHGE